MWAAFLLGLAGSFHCLLMCGPLLVMMSGTSHFTLLSQLLYHSSRLLCYGLLGFLAATLGMEFKLTFGHQFMAVLVGLIICLVGFQKLMTYSRFAFQLKGLDYLTRQVIKFYTNQKMSHVGIRGFLNGMLPCGLVYVALSAAFLTVKPIDAFWFMMVFGGGTLPVLISLLFFKPLYEKISALSFHKVIPFVVILFGLWLMLRGLGLGISFVSPSSEQMLLTEQVSSKVECQ